MAKNPPKKIPAGEYAMKFSRYLIGNFLRMFLLVLLGAVFMFIVIDFVGNIRTWLLRDMADVREYYLAYLPYIVYLVTPVALFIGVVASVGNMSRHLEITAIQQSGRSPFRVLVPVFGVGVLVTLFSFYLDAKILPDANHERYKIMEPLSQQRRDPRIKDKRDFVYISGDRTSWFMRSYGGTTKVGRDVVLLIYRDGDLYERYDAKRLRWIEPDTSAPKSQGSLNKVRKHAVRREEGKSVEKSERTEVAPDSFADSLKQDSLLENEEISWKQKLQKSAGAFWEWAANGFKADDDSVALLEEGYWRLEEGFRRTFLKEGVVQIRHFVRESLKNKTTLLPEDFLDERQRGDEMDAKTILRKIEVQKRSGENTNKLETAYFFKFSGSVMNFIVLLIGAALAHRFSRNGGLSQKFGVGILLVFSYYVVIRIGLKMGENGALYPMLGAWIGHIVFAMIAIWMLYRSFRL